MSRSFIRAEVVELVGWTLLHFVWQALVVALIAAFAVQVLRLSARGRYAICCGSLLLMVVFPIATLFNLTGTLGSPSERTLAPTAEPNSVATASSQVGFVHEFYRRDPAWQTKEAPSWLTLRTMLPYGVSLWAVGVLLLSIRAAVGLVRLRALCIGALPIECEEVQWRFERLSQQLNLSWVKLRSSSRISVPAVIGTVRPMVLLPVSVLTSLTPAEIESLLTHELCHIRRRDHLVNLLQLFAETIFFFHPCVWWLSNRIRIEREYCCDDLAIEISGNRLSFARALERIERMRCAAPQYAVAASGGSLLDRIRRIVDGERQTAGSPLVPLALVIALLLTCVSWQSVLQGQENTATTDGQLELSGLTLHELGQAKEGFFIEARTGGVSPVELVKHFCSNPALGPNKREFFQRGMITNQDSVVSAYPTERKGDVIVSSSVNLSLPQGSEMRAIILGRLSNTFTMPSEDGHGTVGLLVVDRGKIQLVEKDGTIRAEARSENPDARLIIISDSRYPDIGLRLGTNRADGTSGVVVVEMSPSEEDDSDQDHGWIGYEIFPVDKEDGKPLRFKIQWRYDLQQLLKEAEAQAGSQLEEIIRN